MRHCANIELNCWGLAAQSWLFGLSRFAKNKSDLLEKRHSVSELLKKGRRKESRFFTNKRRFFATLGQLRLHSQCSMIIAGERLRRAPNLKHKLISSCVTA
jgi:hypothetical protein